MLYLFLYPGLNSKYQVFDIHIAWIIPFRQMSNRRTQNIMVRIVIWNTLFIQPPEQTPPPSPVHLCIVKNFLSLSSASVRLFGPDPSKCCIFLPKSYVWKTRFFSGGHIFLVPKLTDSV